MRIIKRILYIMESKKLESWDIELMELINYSENEIESLWKCYYLEKEVEDKQDMLKDIIAEAEKLIQWLGGDLYG